MVDSLHLPLFSFITFLFYLLCLCLLLLQLFVDRLSGPLDMVIKGNASVGIKGRTLGQVFNLEIISMDMIGKARLGGKTYCLYSDKEYQSQL